LRNFVSRKASNLDDPIDKVLSELDHVNPGTDDYATLLTTLERLYQLQKDERSSRVSPDTLAVVAANLLGILIIVGYEQGHVVVSRGLGFILRTKYQ
jgi:hypothetical protein